MTDKLKPCPFCGGEAKIRCVGLDGWRIICKKGCCTVGDSLMDEEVAIKAWNKREDL